MSIDIQKIFNEQGRIHIVTLRDMLKAGGKARAELAEKKSAPRKAERLAQYDRGSDAIIFAIDAIRSRMTLTADEIFAKPKA